jgi:hypothetical protein
MADIAHQAWMVSATQDLRYAVTAEPTLAIRMLHRYMDAVLLAASVDEKIANIFLNVLNMLAGPAALQRPQTMLRVIPTPGVMNLGTRGSSGSVSQYLRQRARGLADHAGVGVPVVGQPSHSLVDGPAASAEQ